MKTLQQLSTQAVQALQPQYGEREAKNVVNYWLEHALNLRPTDRILRLHDTFLFEQFEEELERLKANEPVQYVVGKAYFLGLALRVNEFTLIPRPETEELVQWVLELLPSEPVSIVDIGTGSGCIALGLKAARPDCEVIGLDVDDRALELAQSNALTSRVDVEFRLVDALNETLPPCYIGVSNPPYIPMREKEEMASHVVGKEPDRALFVPNEDPLMFYRAIAQKLDRVAFEIHHLYGAELMEMLDGLGFKKRILRQDLQGRDRMIFAERI